MTLYCGTLPNQKTCRFDELATAFDQKAFQYSTAPKNLNNVHNEKNELITNSI